MRSDYSVFMWKAAHIWNKTYRHFHDHNDIIDIYMSIYDIYIYIAVIPDDITTFYRRRRMNFNC